MHWRTSETGPPEARINSLRCARCVTWAHLVSLQNVYPDLPADVGSGRLASIMTNDYVRTFRSKKEALEARPDLDLDCVIPYEEFERLIAPTDFPKTDWVRCQLRKKDGRHCGRQHGIGWIARTKGGAEGFLGGDCTARDFPESSVFHLQASEIRQRIERQDLVSRILGYLEDPDYAFRLTECIRDCGALRDAVRKARGRLPNRTLERLHDMTRRSNASVLIRACYAENEEVDGKVKEVRKWRDMSWQSIDAPHGLYIGTIEKIAEDLIAARAALNTAQPHVEMPRRELKALADELELLDSAASRLADSRHAFDLFMRPENLKRLPWVVRQEDARLGIVRWVLETVSGKHISESDARQALRKWHEEVRVQVGAVDVAVL